MINQPEDNLKNPQNNFISIIDAVQNWSRNSPDRTAMTFLPDGIPDTAVSWTYRELDRRIRAIGAAIQTTEKSDGSTVLLMVPAGPEFVSAFFGTLYSGSIAVPMSPPGIARMARTFTRMARILDDTGSRIILTISKLRKAVEEIIERVHFAKDVSIIELDHVSDETADMWKRPAIAPDTAGWLQYTSGSTSDPKGVIVTHGNIIANLKSILEAMQIRENTPMLHWLPPFHDMGLVGGLLTPIYCGCHCVTMPPMAFLRRPLCWLKACEHYHICVTGGPNFSFDTCVDRISEDKLKDLDLSSITVFYCGSEPIRSKTVRRFVERFKKYGLNPKAFFPCYGMAENTLYATGTQNDSPDVFCAVDRAKYEDGIVEFAREGDGDAWILVSSGHVGLNNEVRIVDPEMMTEVPDAHIGEIWIKGDCVAAGYWNQEEKTRTTLKASLEPSGDGPYLRTGDLGFMHNGHLYVSGRSKEMIILNGRNFFPQDLEESVLQTVPGLEQNGAAAFGVETDAGERLVMVFETKLRKEDLEDTAAAVRACLSAEYDVAPRALVFVKRHGVPKTTSGKIQQSLCRRMLQEGELPVIYAWEEQEITGGLESWGERPPAAVIGTSSAVLCRQWEDWLSQGLAKRLGLDPSMVGRHTPFTSFGMKSALAVSLTGELEQIAGRPLPATLFYDYADIASLAACLAGSGTDRTSGPSAGSAVFKPVAVVGMGLRVPGAASPEDLEQLIFSGTDAITRMPEDRQLPAGDNGERPWGGYIDNISYFDAGLFAISPREAEEMDPQQRQLLEVSWEALERANIAPDSLRGSRTGVFVGVSGSDYENGRLVSGNALNHFVGTGNARSIAANRLSYVYGLEGPSMAVDSACSSSLLAMHLACRSLQNGECDMALAAGVNLLGSTAGQRIFEDAHLMAPDGRCKTFSDKADGYVRSEGCLVMVLKPLEAALKDGSKILGVIRGSAVNQDGASSGLTAPNRRAQAALLREALACAGLEPADIDCLEAHGTGTALGDPIEFGAISDVYAGRDKRSPLVVSSIKTNIGHLEAAAGLAGAARVLVSLKADAIPPVIHLKNINPQIHPETIPAVIPTEILRWPRGGIRPRRAGVSSFGFGGTNVHVIFEEAPVVSTSCPTEKDEIYVFPLSATSPERMKILCGLYASSLASMSTGDGVPAGACLSACLGRASLPHRLCFAGLNIQKDLRAFLYGHRSGFSGYVPDGARNRGYVLVLDDGSGDEAAALPASKALLEKLNSVLPGNASQNTLKLARMLAQAAAWIAMLGMPSALLCSGSARLAGACLTGQVRLEEALGIAAAAETPELPECACPLLDANTGKPITEKNPAVLAASEKAPEEETLLALADRNFMHKEIVALRHGAPLFERTRIVCLVPDEGEYATDRAASALGLLWTRGVEIRWKEVHSCSQARRAALPTYPFARDCYWFAVSAHAPAAIACATPVVPSPAAEPEPILPPAGAGDGPAFRNEAESLDALACEVRSILRLKEDRKLDPADSLVRMGFDSLLFLELTQRLRRRHGIAVAPDILMAAPTLADLAARLMEAGRAAGTGAEPAAIVPDEAGRFTPFQLTDVQHSYWIGRGNGLVLGGVSCSNYVEADLNDLDLARFEQALNKVVARHDMLRCTVGPDGRQTVHQSVPPCHVDVEDLSGMAPEAREARLLEKRGSLSHAVLPLTQAPLWDIRASRLDARRIRLHIKVDLLVSDVFSFGIIARDLAAWYANPALEKAVPALSFRDCVLAMEESRKSDKYRNDRDYWMSRLDALPAGPALPLAKDPSSVGQPRFTRRVARLDRERWVRLKDIARGHALTPSALLLAAFSLTLSRWCSSPDFCLMLTTFDRYIEHPEISEVVGDFTRLLLLEIRRRQNTTFLEHAKGVNGRLTQDMAHQAFSAVEVLRELSKGSAGMDSSRSTVVFTSALPLTSGEFFDPVDGFSADLAYSISQTPQVWLDHQVFEHHGQLVYTWDVVEDLFPEGLIDVLFSTYGLLLERLADEEALWTQPLPLAELPAAQKAVRQRVNETAAEIAYEPVFAGFLRAAETDGSLPAILSDARSLTRAELERESRSLAAVLLKQGFKSGDRAAVLMHKGWEQAVAVYGITRAGGTYLPVDSALPEQRVAFMLSDAGARFCLTQPEFAETVRRCSAVPLVVEKGAAILSDDAAGVTLPEVDPATLSYIIYTSGSTGKPKGVMIEHGAAVNTMADLNERFHVGSGDRALGLASLSFDLSVYDIFGALGAGGALVLPAHDETLDPVKWSRLMREHRVSIWNSTPSVMQLLLDYLDEHPEERPADLRLVMLSGDWIPLGMPGRLRQYWPDLVIAAMGGATEAAIWSNLQIVDEVPPSWHSIPYGKPLANQGYCVLDQDFCHCPDYVPGMLCITGKGLARGYLNNEEKTRASFLTHPATGERLYNTGDLGRYWSDGTVEFVGRKDSQVKINGFRVELGEIEAAICSCPEAHAAAVVAVRGPHGDRLAGFVTLEAGAAQSSKTPEETPEQYEARRQAMLDAGITLIDETERLVYKQAGHNLRQDLSESPRTALAGPDPSQALKLFSRRLSSRRFGQEPVSSEALAGLLGSLAGLNIPQWPTVRHQYGSAGWTYAVQVYVLIRPGRVEGFEDGGCFYYHPLENALVRTGGCPAEEGLFPGHNMDIFTSAAFALYLVADMDAIAPLYGSRSGDFVLIEAGLMSQVLEERAMEKSLGLCQIGAVNFDSLRGAFRITEHHRYLHCLAGGPVQRGADWDFTMAMSESLPDQAFGGEAGIIETVRGRLSQWLPEYMVPGTMTVLPAMPMTANGKIDRRALIKMAEEGRSGTAYTAPEGDGETILAELAARLLGVEKVGALDNFFELGATSIQLVLLQRQIAEKLQREIAITDLFAHNNIRELAAWLFADRDSSEDAFSQARERARRRRQSRSHSRRGGWDQNGSETAEQE